MGIYGESVLLVQEAVNPARRELMKKINKSIRDSLYEIGVNAKVTDKIFFNGAYGFKRNKRDSFEIQININGIRPASTSIGFDNNGNMITNYNYDAKTDMENDKMRFEAMQAVSKNIDKIKANLKRDIKGVEVKLERPEKDFNNTGFTIKAYVVEK